MPKKIPSKLKHPMTTNTQTLKFADRLLANREARQARRKSILAGLKKAGGLLWEHRDEIAEIIGKFLDKKLPSV